MTLHSLLFDAVLTEGLLISLRGPNGPMGGKKRQIWKLGISDVIGKKAQEGSQL